MNILPRILRTSGCLAGVALAVALAPDAAHADSLAYARCASDLVEDSPVPTGARCTTLDVPLDHSGTTPGTVRLAVMRVPATGTSTDTLVVLTGGPGEAALPQADRIVRSLGSGVRRSHDIVLLDQRGSGASGAVECPDLSSAGTVAACAEELGALRPFLTTQESSADLEDLRIALGTPKLSLFAVAYGAQLAGEFARRFPASTGRLVLDSPTPIDGVDNLLSLQQLGLPRVLRELCSSADCRRALPNPAGTLSMLVGRLERGSISGTVVSTSGRRTPARLTVDTLYALVTLSDLSPALRAQLPAAIASGSHGDVDPLLALAEAAGKSPITSNELLNQARFLATSCVEGRLPWAPDSPLAGRGAALRTAVENLDPDRYRPFSAETIIAASPVQACRYWPATPPPRGVANEGPDVPVLVIGGRDDLRTPLEDARRTAGQYPHGTVLAVPDVGHEVLGSDPTACTRSAIDRFLAGAEPATCGRRSSPLRATSFVPKSADRLAVAPGLSGRPGRTATGVRLALEGIEQGGLLRSGGDIDRAVRVPGLRGGWAQVSRGRIVLHRVEWVSGVRLDGDLSSKGGTLRVSGRSASAGTLRRSGSTTLRGRLGGRVVAVKQP